MNYYKGDRCVVGAAFRAVVASASFIALSGSVYAQSTYDEWRAQNFSGVDATNEAVSGLLATPNEDGLTNLVKYSLGLDVDELPTDAIVKIESVSADNLSVSFERPAGLTDVTYQIQYTADLGNPNSWRPATLSPQNLSGGRVKVTATDPMSGTAGIRFSRLRVLHSSGVVSGPASNLQAQNSSPTSIDLSWDGTAGAGGYLVEQELDSGQFEIVGFADAGTEQFTVNNLVPDRQARFRVSAVGSNVNTSPTNIAESTPVLGSEGAVLVRHNNSQPDAGNFVRFEIRVENSTNRAIPLEDLTVRYWFTNDGQSPTATDVFNLRTNLAGLDSDDDLTISQFVQDPELPGANAYLEFGFSAGAGNLPGGSSGQPAFVYVEGQTYRTEPFNYASPFLASNDYSLKTGGLDVNPRITLYEKGQLIFGVEPGGGTGNQDRPANPMELVASATSESTIQLLWDDNASNESLYVIERDFTEDTEGFKILTTVDPNESSFSDLELLDEAQYRYRVRAVNPDGVSSATNIASAVTLEAPEGATRFIPVSPASLDVTTFSDGRLDLDWSDSSRNERGFIIERREGSGPFVEIARVFNGTSEYLDFGLDPNRQYTYRVSAFNRAGTSASSAAEAASTERTPAPTPPTDAEITRFLRHATFGATPELIAEVRSKGFEAWIDDQFDLAPSLHLPALRAASPGQPASQEQRQEVWWNIILTGEDQVRQRLAFALSQILVVSDKDGDLADQAEGLANYYDMLLRAADTNNSFRQLLEQVTLSPVMGNYLDHLRNQKANPATNVRPDENYAREIMQLFSIGLDQLNLDGTPMLDSNGRKIPTYNQNDIVQVARVFTGMTFATSGNYFTNAADYINPMRLVNQFHETGTKIAPTLGLNIPAGQTVQEDLDDIHDVLANHPSTAPFICRRLIQRTVTSNPSPAYVERVASVFNNNGSGKRGDLRAVFKAILLDYEARSADPIDSPFFGKQREPLIRVVSLLRALNASPGANGFELGSLDETHRQAALSSPSVFNFFESDFAQPGNITRLGLDSPEFQVAQSSTVITTANYNSELIYNGKGSTNLDYSRYEAVANDVDALLELLSLDLMDGRLTPANQSPGSDASLGAVHMILKDYLTGLPSGQRVRAALYLITTSAEFIVEN